jgi:hypothetical protein
MTRRTVLALAVLAAAGCHRKASPPPPHVDPDLSAIGSLVADEATLLTATTDPAEFALHLQHYVALGGSAADYSAPPTEAIGSPRPLLRSSVASCRDAAINAVDGTHAATFASIAACHDVMLNG